jgi:hypothetical protein
MDISLIVTLVLVVGAVGLNFFQIRALDKRLTALEKQYLALVADLEEKIYPG